MREYCIILRKKHVVHKMDVQSNKTHPRTEVPPTVPSTPAARLLGHEGPIHAITLSHDGKYCLTAGHDRTVRLWNPTRIDPVHAAVSAGQNPTGSTAASPLEQIPPALPIQAYGDGHTHPVSAVAIDHSSTTLLSSSDRALVVTDVITRRLKRRFVGHNGRINAVACSAGAEVFLSGSYDATVRLWDGRSFDTRPMMVLDHSKDSVTSLRVMQEEEHEAPVEILTGSVDGTVRTYDLRRGELRSDHLGDHIAVTSVTTTKDALCNVVSCLDGRIHLLERSTGDSLLTFRGGHTAGRYSLQSQVTADDRYVVTGSEDGAVVVYDFQTGKVVQTLKGHVRPTCAVACHPKLGYESVVISGSYDGHAVVWTNGDSNLIQNE